MKSGLTCLVGRPNTGKSSLINSIFNEKLSIVSNIRETTRSLLSYIYTDNEAEINFVDTPGIHKAKDKFGNYLNSLSEEVVEASDVVLLVIDFNEGFSNKDRYIYEKIKVINPNIFLVINKIDGSSFDKVLPLIDSVKDLGFKEIIPVSARKNINVKELLNLIKTYMPEGGPYYEKGRISYLSNQFKVAEIVREKLFYFLREEVPHNTHTFTSFYEEKDNIFDIKVIIVVGRENLKKIIIGKGGSRLKDVGTSARCEIEKLLGKKVYLELEVKTLKNWRDNIDKFLEIGSTYGD